MQKETLDDITVVGVINLGSLLFSMLTQFETTLRITVLLLSGAYTIWKFYRDIKNKEK